MELTQRTLLQVLLRRSNVVARRQISDDLLAHPAAVEEARPGVGETPFQVGYDTIVGALLSKIVGILKIQGLVCAAYKAELDTQCRSTTQIGH